MLATVRAKSARSRRAGPKTSGKDAKTIPTFHEFLSEQDYMGAATVLEFQLKVSPDPEEDALRRHWLAYAYFHVGEYGKAAEVCMWFAFLCVFIR